MDRQARQKEGEDKMGEEADERVDRACYQSGPEARTRCMEDKYLMRKREERKSSSRSESESESWKEGGRAKWLDGR